LTGSSYPSIRKQAFCQPIERQQLSINQETRFLQTNRQAAVIHHSGNTLLANQLTGSSYPSIRKQAFCQPIDRQQLASIRKQAFCQPIDRQQLSINQETSFPPTNRQAAVSHQSGNMLFANQ
jgi:hypothetical protein